MEAITYNGQTICVPEADFESAMATGVTPEFERAVTNAIEGGVKLVSAGDHAMHNMKKTTINSIINELGEMGKVEERRIKDIEDDFELVDFKALRNTKFKTDAYPNGSYVRCKGLEYTVIQHQEAFEPFLGKLEAAGFKDCFANVYEDAKRAIISVILGEKIVPRDGQPVWLGFQMENTFNTKTSVRFSVHAVRMCCSNQFRVGNIIPNGDLNVIHTGKKEDRLAKIEEFVGNLEVAGTHLCGIIDGAMQKPLTDVEAGRVLQNLKYSDFFAQKTMTNYKLVKGSNAYDLYNAIAATASWESRYTYATVMRRMDPARKVLQPGQLSMLVKEHNVAEQLAQAATL